MQTTALAVALQTTPNKVGMYGMQGYGQANGARFGGIPAGGSIPWAWGASIASSSGVRLAATPPGVAIHVRGLDCWALVKGVWQQLELADSFSS